MDKDNPLVSVIIPCYNAENYLAETLQSVLAQDYSPMEIILIDDGSTDHTPSIVKKHPSISYHRQEKKGNTAARNYGARQARGAYLAFLDADDLWEKQKTAKQVASLENHPETDAVICLVRHFLEPGTAKPAWLRKELLEKNVPGYLPSALMVRKDVFFALGGFNEHYQISSDADWFVKFTKHGKKLFVLDETLVRKRVHHHNESGKTQIIYKELLDSLHKNLQSRP